MIKVKQIVSGGWPKDGISFEDKVNAFLSDKTADQIVDIKIDFGNLDSDYMVAYIFYTPNK